MPGRFKRIFELVIRETQPLISLLFATLKVRIAEGSTTAMGRFESIATTTINGRRLPSALGQKPLDAVYKIRFQLLYFKHQHGWAFWRHFVCTRSGVSIENAALDKEFAQ